jgi:uncharacterized delta-60 repeat protein
VARQGDGSLVFAGRTESIQGKYVEGAVLVQRRLPDGSLDPSFHPVVDDAGGYGPVGLALQPDGSIFYSTAGEYSGAVHRLGPDGTIDGSYGSKGTVALGFDPQFMAVDAQGRTVVAGTAGVGGDCHDCLPTPVVEVARLMPDGTFDKSFGKGGTLTVTPPEGGYGPAVGLALEPGGGIVVAGEGVLYGLTADGAPDPAFGHEGTVVTEGIVGALTETSAGDVIAAQTTAHYCCEKPGAFLLQAFRADGSLDPTWGSGGTTTIKVADIDFPTALAPGADGTVLFAGETAFADQAEGCRECSFQPYLARLGPDGAVDPTFAPTLGGPTNTYRQVGASRGYAGRVAAMAVLPGGGVLLAGTTDPDGSIGEQATATELSSSGSPEPGFGTAGVAFDAEPLPSSTQATGFAAGPHGRLVASYATDGKTYGEGSGIAAWTADGKAVKGYGGSVPLSYADPSTALAADGRGRLYRIEQRHYFVRRLGTGGRPDLGYGSEGKGELPPHFVAKGLVVRRSGAVLVVGRIADREPMALFELTPAGRPDPRFGKRGLALIHWRKGAKATALSATFDCRGRIVLFGVFGRQTPLARLLPDGRLDPSFGHGGRVNFKALLETEVSSVTVAEDGRIYLATSREDPGETTLVRFRADGARDRSFGTGGVVRIEEAPSLVRLFVGGRRLVLVSGNGEFRSTGVALRAFHLDGGLDTSFAHRGVYEGGSGVTKKFGAIGAVREADGDIVVAGTRRPRGYGEKLELLRFR